MKVPPDFDYAKPQSDTKLLFVHRSLPQGEVYWVDNRNNRAESLDATFRVRGKAAELWHADTGKIEPASYRTANGRTIVPLRLQPYEAVFVVFRNPAAAPSRTLPVSDGHAHGHGGRSLGGSLPAEPRRARRKSPSTSLTSWSENSDSGVQVTSPARGLTRRPSRRRPAGSRKARGCGSTWAT